MSKAYIFNMLSRTACDPLPTCNYYGYEDGIGYRVEFRGTREQLCSIPHRLDIAVDNNILISDAKLQAVENNVAVYYAYAIHFFDEVIPN